METLLLSQQPQSKTAVFADRVLIVQALRIWEHDLANKHRARLVKKLHTRGLVGP